MITQNDGFPTDTISNHHLVPTTSSYPNEQPISISNTFNVIMHFTSYSIYKKYVFYLKYPVLMLVNNENLLFLFLGICCQKVFKNSFVYSGSYTSHNKEKEE